MTTELVHYWLKIMQTRGTALSEMAPPTVTLTPILKKLVPLCFVTGAAMEVFMVTTGFCTFV